jgi:hypothetical protein
VRELELAVALDVDAVGGVDHHLRDGRVGEVTLDRAVTEDVIRQLGNEPCALVLGERHLLRLDDAAQLLHDERAELFRRQRRVAQARAETCEQRVLRTPLQHAEGIGVVAIGDRVGALDGRLEVESSPGRGTQVRAVIPLDGS